MGSMVFAGRHGQFVVDRASQGIEGHLFFHSVEGSAGPPAGVALEAAVHYGHDEVTKSARARSYFVR